MQVLGINLAGCEPRIYQKHPRKRETKMGTFGDRGSKWMHSKVTEANCYYFMGYVFQVWNNDPPDELIEPNLL